MCLHAYVDESMYKHTCLLSFFQLDYSPAYCVCVRTGSLNARELGLLPLMHATSRGKPCAWPMIIIIACLGEFAMCSS